MATCPEPDILLDFLEERLSPAEVTALRAHLDACPACPEVLTQFARVSIAERGAPRLSMGHQRTHPASSPSPRPALLTFSAGELVAGRYRIVRFLAQGGMGQVYQAHDRELAVDVALKTILPSAGDEPPETGRFKREVLLARRVSHTNVCRIFDLGLHQRTGPAGAQTIHFLTMELLDGCTLAQRLRERGPLSPQEALPLVRQMSLALEAAHQQAVVHRDFKPDNVFLVPTPPGVDRLVVTDFGLARTSLAMGEIWRTGDGKLVGTPAYMAPEQVQGGTPGPASDIYALGVVMYQMVTGVLPFTGSAPVAVALQRTREAPPSPRVHRPDLDRRWERTILRCLAREPAARFSSAADVRRALVAWRPGAWWRRG